MGSKETRKKKPSKRATHNQPTAVIRLKTDEYRRLLEMVFCGNWLINSWRDDGETLAEYDELEDRLLSYAAEAGLPEAAELDKQSGQRLFSRAFEKAVHDRFIPDFENEVFWGELSQRLAWRDLERLFGADGLTRMGSRERESAIERFEDRYWQEFDTHGLDHLIVTAVDEPQGTSMKRAWPKGKEAEA
ncbi:MAG: hypothetical protein PHT12_00975 [Patescibacteria group bacterium]|nr:hypothetical protein [Patescibacteria group bacterium]